MTTGRINQVTTFTVAGRRSTFDLSVKVETRSNRNKQRIEGSTQREPRNQPHEFVKTQFAQRPGQFSHPQSRHQCHIPDQNQFAQSTSASVPFWG